MSDRIYVTSIWGVPTFPDGNKITLVCRDPNVAISRARTIDAEEYGFSGSDQEFEAIIIHRCVEGRSYLQTGSPEVFRREFRSNDGESWWTESGDARDREIQRPIDVHFKRQIAKQPAKVVYSLAIGRTGLGPAVLAVKSQRELNETTIADLAWRTCSTLPDPEKIPNFLKVLRLRKKDVMWEK